MTRVLSLLFRNDKEGIPPDRTTGELAAQIVVWLARFTGKAGVKLPKLEEGEEPDMARFVTLTKARIKETKARYRRHRNRRRKQN